MLQFFLALSIVLILTAAQAEDRRADKTRLVIMTVNAEFLWDGIPPEEGNADFPWKGSQSEAEEHMAKIAALIIHSNPDLINLVEVENLHSLSTFNDQFLSGRGYKPYFVQGKDTQTGQDVTLLTRIDPENEQIHRDDRKGQMSGITKAVSKNYIAKFNIENMQIALVGTHFLAFPLHQGRRAEREAQADALRSVAIELRSQGYWPIILGDLNDYDGAADSLDHIDSTPISQVLSMLRGMAPSVATDDLVNAASFAPKAIRYTAHHDANQDGQVQSGNELTSIDHVLLAPELAAKVESVDFPHNHDPRFVTDHFPIVVHLRLSSQTVPPSSGLIRIESLLPNPPGDETQNETVTLKNSGTTTVSVGGWKLRDLAGQIWTLDTLGSLNAGESKTIQRKGQKMSLNNNGDTIDLVNPASTVVHTVTYSHADEDEVIVAP